MTTLSQPPTLDSFTMPSPTLMQELHRLGYSLHHDIAIGRGCEASVDAMLRLPPDEAALLALIIASFCTDSQEFDLRTALLNRVKAKL